VVENAAQLVLLLLAVALFMAFLRGGRAGAVRWGKAKLIGAT
jgi:hypothetical protein